MVMAVFVVLRELSLFYILELKIEQNYTFHHIYLAYTVNVFPFRSLFPSPTPIFANCF